MSIFELIFWYVFGYSVMLVIILAGFFGVVVVLIGLFVMIKDKQECRERKFGVICIGFFMFIWLGFLLLRVDSIVGYCV